jgi:hypothetical protein
MRYKENKIAMFITSDDSDVFDRQDLNVLAACEQLRIRTNLKICDPDRDVGLICRDSNLELNEKEFERNYAWGEMITKRGHDEGNHLSWQT